jgi:hypothetical protein
MTWARAASAVIVSLAMTGSIIVLFLLSGPSPRVTYLVPPLACAAVSMLFAYTWPAGSWRWGFWLSSGFWIFFLLVFLSYLLTGTLDWLTPVRAASVLLAAVIAAWLGASLRGKLTGGTDSAHVH